MRHVYCAPIVALALGLATTTATACDQNALTINVRWCLGQLYAASLSNSYTANDGISLLDAYMSCQKHRRKDAKTPGTPMWLITKGGCSTDNLRASMRTILGK